MAGGLKFMEETNDDGLKLSLIGEVDIYTSNELKDKLYNIVETCDKDIFMDCKDLKYIDSTGLGIFVGALKKSKQEGKKIVIMNLKENIKKLFLITGLDKVFDIR